MQGDSCDSDSQSASQNDARASVSDNTIVPMFMSVAGVALASLSLASVSLGEVTRGHYVEIFSNSRDQVLVRTKRSSEVCKYKKGAWSECDKLVMVSYLCQSSRFDIWPSYNSTSSLRHLNNLRAGSHDWPLIGGE